MAVRKIEDQLTADEARVARNEQDATEYVRLAAEFEKAPVNPKQVRLIKVLWVTLTQEARDSLDFETMTFAEADALIASLIAVF